MVLTGVHIVVKLIIIFMYWVISCLYIFITIPLIILKGMWCGVCESILNIKAEFRKSRELYNRPGILWMLLFIFLPFLVVPFLYSSLHKNNQDLTLSGLIKAITE